MSYTLNLTSVQTCASFHLLMWNLGLSWVFQYTSMKLELHLWPIQSPNNQSPPGLPLITDPFGGFQVCPIWRSPGQTQNSLEGFYIPSGLGTPRDPPGGAGEGGWGERCLGFPPGPVASVTRRQIRGRWWMDGLFQWAILCVSMWIYTHTHAFIFSTHATYHQNDCMVWAKVQGGVSITRQMTFHKSRFPYHIYLVVVQTMFS